MKILFVDKKYIYSKKMFIAILTKFLFLKFFLILIIVFFICEYFRKKNVDLVNICPA